MPSERLLLSLGSDVRYFEPVMLHFRGFTSGCVRPGPCARSALRTARLVLDGARRVVLVGTVVALVPLHSRCSRARVESMTVMNEGVALARRKNFPEAIEKLSEAKAKDPRNFDALFNLAQVHLEMGNLEAAKAALEEGAQAQGDDPRVHEKLGTVLLELGRFEAAIPVFQRALTLDAQQPRAHYKLAQAFTEVGKDQDALEALTQAAKTGKRFLPAFLLLGQKYHAFGFSDHALRVYDSGLAAAVAGSEEAATLHYLKGNVYRDGHQNGQALAAYDQALELVPTMANALFSKGWLLADMERGQEAITALEAFLKYKGQSPPHYVSAASERLSRLSASL